MKPKKISKTSKKELTPIAKEVLRICNTGAKFTERFNLDYCVEKYQNYKTVKDALLSKKVKITDLVLCYDKNLLILWIRAWLTNLSAYMNFEITEMQSRKTAIFILEDCYMLNIVELTLLFKRIMKGYYGQFFGKFNGQIILHACKEYRKERGQILSKIS